MSTDPNADLGRRLRALRRERGLSLAEVAEATGISTSFLSHVETGKGDITFSRLSRLVELYGVTMLALVPQTRAETQVVRGDSAYLANGEAARSYRNVGRGTTTHVSVLDAREPPS